MCLKKLWARVRQVLHAVPLRCAVSFGLPSSDQCTCNRRDDVIGSAWAVPKLRNGMDTVVLSEHWVV